MCMAGGRPGKPKLFGGEARGKRQKGRKTQYNRRTGKTMINQQRKRKQSQGMSFRNENMGKKKNEGGGRGGNKGQTQDLQNFRVS